MEAIPSDDRRAGKPSGRLKERAVLAERFCIALEDSPVIVFNQDRLLRYTWINSPSLCWAATDYIGRTDKEIVGGIEGERLTTVKTKVLETGVASGDRPHMESYSEPRTEVRSACFGGSVRQA